MMCPSRTPLKHACHAAIILDNKNRYGIHYKHHCMIICAPTVVYVCAKADKHTNYFSHTSFVCKSALKTKLTYLYISVRVIKTVSTTACMKKINRFVKTWQTKKATALANTRKVVKPNSTS